jgi:hypothetical protein
MAFDIIEILNGGLSLVFVLVSVAVGINIISKYFRLKNSTYLYMGLSWIGITSPWWGSTISFFTYMIMGEGIDLWFYLVMTLTFVPVFFLFYAKAITDLLWKNYQTFILAIFFIIGIIFEGFYLYCSFTAPETIGSLEQETDIRYFNFVTLYLIFIIFTLMIFGILFGKVSLKSQNPTVQAQGKFLIIAFVSFAIGAVFDSIIPLNPITLPITRGILISSSLSFYCGFIPPNWLKKKL